MNGDLDKIYVELLYTYFTVSLLFQRISVTFLSRKILREVNRTWYLIPNSMRNLPFIVHFFNTASKMYFGESKIMNFSEYHIPVLCVMSTYINIYFRTATINLRSHGLFR